MAEWIDFREIKERVRIVQVLEYYGLVSGLKERGDELVGICPFCQKKYYQGSFSANVKKNCWQCFACGRKGNVLEFVAEKEGIGLREAGLLIKEKIILEVEDEGIKPLTFELKNLEKEHPFFKERGLDKRTIEEFGLGYCKRGLMKGYIVIPVHDAFGNLVAYVGRYPAQKIPPDKTKYRFPPQFKKSLVLYNLHRVKGFACSEIILVEGFFDVFSLWQKGIKNVVALMGVEMSETQEKLLLELLGEEGKLKLAFDNDEAGRKAEKEIIERLIGKVYLKRLSSISALFFELLSCYF